MVARGDPGFDRLHKLRPLLDTVKTNCLKEYASHHEVSIDEAMIGFKGKRSMEQNMPMKPTKGGFKFGAYVIQTTATQSIFLFTLGESEACTGAGL